MDKFRDSIDIAFKFTTNLNKIPTESIYFTNEEIDGSKEFLILIIRRQIK